MILTETNIAFPLSSVKPLDGIRAYRQYCLETVKKAGGGKRRDKSPITGAALVPAGDVDGLAYGRCPDTGSLFLLDLPNDAAWADVLAQVNRRKNSPNGFHAGVAGSRTENVYLPKLDWIESTLQIQGLSRPAVLEAADPSSRFTALLKSSGVFVDVQSVSEMDLVGGQAAEGRPAQAAVLLESLDHVSDPQKLLDAVGKRMVKDGLLFVTALVASGFDMMALGFNNLYLCPPDRTNVFTLAGLEKFLKKAGFALVEASTPGVLDIEIVQAHLAQGAKVSLSPFERQLMAAEADVKQEFQSFLQKGGFSSFARIVGRKL